MCWCVGWRLALCRVGVWGYTSVWSLLCWGFWGFCVQAQASPAFVSTPVTKAPVGDLYRYLVRVWRPDRREARLSVQVKGVPAWGNFRLVMLGRVGCCVWQAVLTGRLTAEDAGKKGEILLEAVDIAEPTSVATQRFQLEVAPKNRPPAFTPPTVSQREARRGEKYTYSPQVQDADHAASHVSLSLVEGPSGMTWDAGAGQLIWQTGAADVGFHGVVMRATDPLGGMGLLRYLLEVKPENAPPAFVSVPLEGATLGEPYVYALRARDPDAQDTLFYTLKQGPAGMSVHSTGWLVWPTPSGAGSTHAVSVEVRDRSSGGLSALQNWTLKVFASNQRPQIISPFPIEATQGAVYRALIQASDADQTDTLRFVLEQSPIGAQILAKDSRSAEVVWTPRPEEVGMQTLVVRVDDGRGGVAWSRSQIHVQDINDPPAFVAPWPLAVAVQGKAYKTQIFAKDPDVGARLRFLPLRLPVGMRLDGETGWLYWTPDATHVGKPQEVELTVEDQHGLRSKTPLRWTIQVIAEPSPPVFASVPSAFSLVEGQAWRFLISASHPDPNQRTIRYRIEDAPLGMQINESTGEILWTPTREDVGKHLVWIEAWNDAGLRAQQALSLEVRGVNQAPVLDTRLSNPGGAAMVGVMYTYLPVVRDPDGDRLHFSLERAPLGMSVEETGWVAWTPKDADADQTFRFVWVARDPSGLEARQEITLKVYPKNQPPSIKQETLSKLRSLYKLPADRAWEFLLPSASDADRDALTYILEDAPEGVALATLKETTEDLYVGRLSWTPNTRQIGLHALRVRVEDGRGGIFRLRLMVEVGIPESLGGNEQPVIQSEPPTRAYVGKSMLYQPRIQEIIPTAGTWLFALDSGAPSGMSIDVQSGRLAWTPKTSDAATAHTVRLLAKKFDASQKVLFSLEQSFVLWVEAVAVGLPSQGGGSATGDQDQPFSSSFQLLQDHSAAWSSVRLIEGPSGLDVAPYSGVGRWLPNARDVGTHKVVLQIEAEGEQRTITGSIVIKDRNDPPMISSTPWLGLVAGTTANTTLAANDGLDLPPDTPLRWSLWQAPSGASIVAGSSPPNLSWNPPMSDIGRRLLVLEVEDQRGAKTVQAAVLNVVGQNRPPTWTKQPIGLPAPIALVTGQVWKSTVAATDPDGDRVWYRIAVGPEGLVIAEVSGELLWTPPPKAVGSFLAEIQAVDPNGGVASLQIPFEVTRGADTGPRFLSKPPLFTQAGENYRYELRVDDPNDAPSTLQISLAQAPQGMVFDPQSRTLSWSVPASTQGLFSVSLVVADASGLTATQSYLLSVHPLPVSPKILSSPPSRAAEGERLIYPVLVSKSADVSVSFSLLQAPHGMEIHAQSGVVSWTPNAQDARTREHTVEIAVVDTRGESATQRFALWVEGRNARPRFVSAICPEAIAGQKYNCVVKAEDLDRRPSEGGSWLFFRLRSAPDGMSVPASAQAIRVADGGSVATVLLEWTPRANQVGNFSVVLEVRDSEGDIAVSEHSIRVSSEQKGPIANAGEDRKGIFPQEIELDGSESIAPEGATEALRYQWQVRQSPADEKIQILDADARRARVILRRAGDYLFQLTVRSGAQDSLPDLVEVSVRNVPPSAAVDAPLRVETLPEGTPRKIYTLIGQVGQEIALDASPSDDANGDLLRFSWSQLRKESPLEAPQVEIKDPQEAKARFTPTQAGVYRFQLRVEDIPSQSDITPLQNTATLEVIVHDPSASPVYVPMALLLAPEQGAINEAIRLDASRSVAPFGKIVSYQWRLLTQGEQVRLDQDPQSPANARLTASLPGYYLVALSVEADVQGKRIVSQEQVVGVRVEGQTNRLPIAIAASAHATYETWFQLDASQSIDPAGSQLTFRWVQIDGPSVALRDEKTARPTFFVLRQADYRFRLWVRGGPLAQQAALESAPIDILIRANPKANQPPIAQHNGDLSGERSLKAGIALNKGLLDASQSNDPEGEALRFRWRLVGGFPTPLKDDQSKTPFLVPVVSGILQLSLEVSDGKTWSLPVDAFLAVNDDKNQVPVAHAGADQTVRLGHTARLDGSRSYDKDPTDTLSYHWRLIEPQGAAVLLNTAEPMNPYFAAQDPKIPRYLFGLRVDDGKVRSIESRVQISVEGANQPPVAQIETIGEVFVGQQITLDGSRSFDPNNESLSYRWKQLEGKPVSAQSWTSPTLAFLVESEGSYTFQLQVSDASGASSAPDTLTFRAKNKGVFVGCSCQSNPLSPLLPFSWWIAVLFFFRRIRRRSTIHPCTPQ